MTPSQRARGYGTFVNISYPVSLTLSVSRADTNHTFCL